MISSPSCVGADRLRRSGRPLPIVQPRIWACSLLLVACSCASTTRAFPLVAGVAPRSAITRVDIDVRKHVPPALSFEVDCTALPYEKGRERDFCYEFGSWAVVQHERGIVVACSCGEFGGFVSWYGKDGHLLQTLLAGDVPQTLLCDGDALLCVTGLSHLNISKGAICAFRRVDDRWQQAGSTALPRQVDRMHVDPDGSVVLQLMWDGGTFRYRAGALEQLPSASSSMTSQPNVSPSGARD